ncbi:MAG: pentapeptide repeat-containing protein, partial [Proteobacteria bacterium]|nr:pentapeptide repeat-containing protein [Pseudomonadota bacterium]
TGANLTGANLTGANLWDATLTRADFTDADLTNAFRRPGISRADMDGVKGLDTVKGLLD